jgi:hypothetical protein
MIADHNGSVMVEFEIIGSIYFDKQRLFISRYSYNNLQVLDLDTEKRIYTGISKKLVIIETLKYHIPCDKISWMISESKRRFMSLIEIVKHETY